MKAKVQKNQMAERWYKQSKYNICTDFLLPMLDIREAVTDNYVNCYYLDINYPYITDKIILVYDIDKHVDDYPSLYRSLTSNRNFHSYYTYFDNGNKEKYVFTVPPNLKRDYGLILEGRYSQTSERYKQQVLSYWNKTNNSRLGGILYKRHYQNEDNLYILNEKEELLAPPTDNVIKCYDISAKEISALKTKRLQVDLQPLLL